MRETAQHDAPSPPPAQYTSVTSFEGIGEFSHRPFSFVSQTPSFGMKKEERRHVLGEDLLRFAVKLRRAAGSGVSCSFFMSR